MTDPAAPLVFLVAGEPSSDLIGGRLMASLKLKAGADLRFAGVGGPRMAAEGLASRFPMEELSLVGFTNVLPRLPRLWRRIRQTAAAIRAARPRVAVFVDASGFARAVARRLLGSGIPVVQYKAPQAWAYWPWRARKMAKYFDETLVILPFEPAFFARYGARTTFIGHPALETGAGKGDGAAFRIRHAIPTDAAVLCVMHGSRRSEIEWSIPLLADAVGRLVAAVPNLRVVVPVIDPVASAVRDGVAAWRHKPVVVDGDVERFDAMAASDAALAVSGTVTVELAVAGVPTVMCYRGSTLTSCLVLLFCNVRYAAIVNLVLDRPVMAEFIQADCRSRLLADSVARLLADPALRQAQRDAYREAVALLDAGSPSIEAAAQAVARYVNG